MSVVERERVEVATDADVLERAADLLEEFGWCRWAGARAEDGQRCWPQDHRAQAFCLAGAITRAAHDFGRPTRRVLAEPHPDYILAWELMDDNNCHAWNDRGAAGKHEVVARLRSRAERARAES